MVAFDGVDEGGCGDPWKTFVSRIWERNGRSVLRRASRVGDLGAVGGGGRRKARHFRGGTEDNIKN